MAFVPPISAIQTLPSMIAAQKAKEQSFVDKVFGFFDKGLMFASSATDAALEAKAKAEAIKAKFQKPSTFTPSAPAQSSGTDRDPRGGGTFKLDLPPLAPFFLAAGALVVLVAVVRR